MNKGVGGIVGWLATDARHGKIRSINEHIVRRFYNQRCDLVTRLRLEPVNQERIFFSSGSFRVEGGEGER